MWASHALTASRLPATIALRLSVLGTYHGRKIPTSSRRPPSDGDPSLRESLDGCMRSRTLQGRQSAKRRCESALRSAAAERG